MYRHIDGNCPDVASDYSASPYHAHGPQPALDGSASQWPRPGRRRGVLWGFQTVQLYMKQRKKYRNQWITEQIND